ncbi:MAG: MarR family transcriptional regulator, partial [Comamonas sp.]
WLERSASEADKRVRCLQLSPAGEQLFVQLKARREEVATQLLQGFPISQKDELLQLLKQALANTRTID